MEKPFKNTDTATHSWIKEAGLEKPSANFSMEVLQKIEVRTHSQKVQPLLSLKSWVFIVAAILLSSVLLFMYPPELELWKDFFATKPTGWDFNMAQFEISESTVYAFIFLSLFLLQIPILKRTLGKNYQ